MRNVIIAVVLLLPLALAQPPPVPAAFYGTFTVEDRPAPVNLTAYAFIGDELVGQVMAPKEGWYGGEGGFEPKLIAIGDHSSEGATVQFRVGRYDGPTATWTSGAVERVDLGDFHDNELPVANAGPGVAGAPGQSLSFNGSGSSDDLGIIRYHWQFGDGMTGEGAHVSHAYATGGARTITLTVTDAVGNKAAATTTATISGGGDGGGGGGGGAGETSTQGPGGEDPVDEPADLLNAVDRANRDLMDSLQVFRRGADNVLQWHLVAGAAGYQIWGSNSPFVLLAAVDAGISQYTHVGAPAETKYLVTAYYRDASGNLVGYVDDPEQAPGSDVSNGQTAQAEEVQADSRSGVGRWIIGGVALGIIAASVVYLMRRTRPPE